MQLNKENKMKDKKVLKLIGIKIIINERADDCKTKNAVLSKILTPSELQNKLDQYFKIYK